MFLFPFFLYIKTINENLLLLRKDRQRRQGEWWPSRGAAYVYGVL